MTRNRNGWLDAASLEAGGIEQYAVNRSYGRIIITLEHDGRDYSVEAPWVVTWEQATGSAVASTATAYADLDDARKRFRSLQKRHP